MADLLVLSSHFVIGSWRAEREVVADPFLVPSCPAHTMRGTTSPRTRTTGFARDTPPVVRSPVGCLSLIVTVVTSLPDPEPLVRLRLTPRNTSFFDLLAEQAQYLVRGADLLNELLSAKRGDRKSLAIKLREAEHDADEATHTIMRRLNQTFVTPFDRDDIYALASRLDDCMDYMEEAGDLVVLYDIDDLPNLVIKQVDVLRRCAELTADAMPRLRSMKNLTEYWVEINRLENEADRTYRRMVAKMFDNKPDPIAVMKLKDVVDALEAGADAFESVANLVETIALKES